jgi:signal transduction histidine kinase
MAEPDPLDAVILARAVLTSRTEDELARAFCDALRPLLGAESISFSTVAEPPPAVSAPVLTGSLRTGWLSARFPAPVPAPPPALAAAAEVFGLAAAHLAGGPPPDLETALREIVHELRTPLTAIRSFSEMLLAHEEDPATAREYVSVIHDEAVRLSRLVGGLLDLSRLRSGRVEWDFRSEDLPAAVRRAARSVSTAAGEKGIVISTRVDPAIGPLVFDRDRVIQVLVNLLSNAVRHGPPGSTVAVTAEAHDGGARLLVTDEGPGVPPDRRDGIFGFEGARGGLGLAISKGIVFAHGGTIGVEEAPGGGAAFYFTLPASPPSAGG